ncbi:MAG: SagB/ThcOx family dehydrogenase [Anaerolineae bacterium]
MPSMTELRKLLQSGDWDAWRLEQTDQRRGLPPPPIEKPCPDGAVLVDLPPSDALSVGAVPVNQAIRQRRSRRKFLSAPLTLEECSFLVWATQGLSRPDGPRMLRTAPSAGARHPFETYLLVNRVEGVAPGLYRYLPLEHQLCLLDEDPDTAREIHIASYEQYVMDSAVTFILTAVPYRTEWRYAALAHRVILMDAGHVCENLYLACEAIGAGACAVGAYDQAQLDAILHVDGVEEMTVYMAPVGRVRA